MLALNKEQLKAGLCNGLQFSSSFLLHCIHTTVTSHRRKIHASQTHAFFVSRETANEKIKALAKKQEAHFAFEIDFHHRTLGSFTQ